MSWPEETDAETSVTVETGSEELEETETPMLDEVMDQLAEDEIVTVEELSVEVGTENGVFLSVVPSAMEKTRETVSLVQGERLKLWNIKYRYIR